MSGAVLSYALNRLSIDDRVTVIELLKRGYKYQLFFGVDTSKMNFNYMALMRRDDVLLFVIRKMFKRGYVSLFVRNVIKRRMQTGRGVLNIVKIVFFSQLGKEILVVSISFVGENAENGYVKSFGKVFDISLKKKKINLGIMLFVLNDAKGSFAISFIGFLSR